MAVADGALVDHVELVVERGRRKALAPDASRHRGAELERQLAAAPARRRSRGCAAVAAADSISRATASNAAMKRGSASRAIDRPAANAWPPKRVISARGALRDQIERVAQVKAGDRAARALELVRRRRARRRSTGR